jgi:hypothetical protein
VFFMPTVQPASPNRDWFAAFLSYLLPGLGQVLQGRIGKGLLFFVSLYSLFFYGMAMGAMKNVWLPSPTALKTPNGQDLPAIELGLGVKLPGVFKSLGYRPQFAGQFWIGMAAWPAVGHYLADTNPNAPQGLPLVGRYMATPPEDELQKLQRDGNKRWDLGWVYTLIAGVLNLLVIYDAFAGPAIRDDENEEKEKSDESNPKRSPLEPATNEGKS